MIRLKTQEDIEFLKEGGHILSEVLEEVGKRAKVGVSTYELNEYVEHVLHEKGAEPSFKNYPVGKGIFYPASLCTSINSIIVHGIPSKKDILKSGDVLGLDLGLKWHGLYVDGAITVGVGDISPIAQKLIDVTKECLDEALKIVKPGISIGDIGEKVQSIAELNGFGVIRDLVGHGVGYKVHEEPKIPNFGVKGQGEKIVPGMVLAIEPMLSSGGYALKYSSDGFGCELRDGSIGAHFEHTVAITEKGYILITI